MKLELKPGVSPAYFWTFIGLGIASTGAGALALTTYAWAGMAAAIIGLIVGFLNANGPKPPPGTAQLLLALLMVIALSACQGVSGWLQSPAGKATVSLAELGLDVAAARGKISPGQVVNVKQGIAVVTDPNDSTVSKIFRLEDLGIKAAVQAGKLQSGDAVIIQQASAIVQSATDPAAMTVQPSGKAPEQVIP